MKSGQKILMFFILIDGLTSTKPKIEKSAVVFGEDEFTMQADKIHLGIEVNNIQDYEHDQEKSKECFGRDVLENRKYILALITIFCVLIFLLLVSSVCIGCYLLYQMLRMPSSPRVSNLAESNLMFQPPPHLQTSVPIDIESQSFVKVRILS